MYVDFEWHVLIVREAKGAKDRVVMLPRSLAPALPLQMLAARAQWEADRQVQRGEVEVPAKDALHNSFLEKRWLLKSSTYACHHSENWTDADLP